MNAIVQASSAPTPGPTLAPLPEPRVPITIRPATPADLPFIDALQKQHSRMVGFMKRAALDGKVAAGQVLIAEEVGSSELLVGSEDANATALPTSNSQLPTPLGYVIAQDRYFKRDDVGIVYQLNVAPGHQRGLVGATLLKAMFDRAAYGCRLFCCWCAQDIEANRFWEAMGFVPLAYRAGGKVRMKAEGGRMKRTDSSFIPQPSSLPRARVHIFWQKRIREGDQTTPWWFPAKTDAGAMRADRIVLPIPLGRHWSDEMPVIVARATCPCLPDKKAKTTGKLPVPRPAKIGSRQFGGPPTEEPVPQVVDAAAPETPKQGGREKKPKAKADPKLVAAARELRDRWLEHVNAGELVLAGAGKYDVTRALESAGAGGVPLALPATTAALPSPPTASAA